MKKSFTSFGMAILVLSFLAPVSAQARDYPTILQECGIGGLIFGKSKPAAAAALNVTIDFGTTAATSDFSGLCAVNSSETTTALFIHESFDVLEAELAKGEGKYLNALINTMQCGDRTSAEAMASVRAKFSKSLAADGYSSLNSTDKSAILYEIVVPQLAASSTESCAVAG